MVYFQNHQPTRAIHHHAGLIVHAMLLTTKQYVIVSQNILETHQIADQNV